MYVIECADNNAIQQCMREVVEEDSGDEDEGGESDMIERKGTS